MTLGFMCSFKAIVTDLSHSQKKKKLGGRRKHVKARMATRKKMRG